MTLQKDVRQEEKDKGNDREWGGSTWTGVYGITM